MNFTLVLPVWLRRATRADVAIPCTFTLAAGRRRDMALAPGDELRVLAGAVLLSRPARWLGDAIVAPATLVLDEGDGWASVERERVTLVANAESRVLRVTRCGH